MIRWLSKKRNQKGFTLIELIVVIAILGILAAIAIPRLGGFQEKAKISSDKATLSTINSAIAIGVADSTIPDGTVTAESADKTGIITFKHSGTDVTLPTLLESGAAFKLTDNMNDSFTWTILDGEITAAPIIADDGVITVGTPAEPPAEG